MHSIFFVFSGIAFLSGVNHAASNPTTSSPTSLPYFLTNNPLPQGYPWGNATAEGTNPYENVPDTGVTRRYEFSIARAFESPDGVNRSMLLINGQFPGPTIEANWGDYIQVTVRNGITDPGEGTSIHWHGISQKGTPWFDGVPSLQQCPIAPGNSFTYTFTADRYGTSFYHAHYSSQYTAGLFGAMVIYGPKHADYDIDLGPIFLTDWYHDDYLAVVQKVVGLPPPLTQPYSDNNLINGRMPYDCGKATSNTSCTPSAPMSRFQFQSGKRHLLRLINASAQGMQRFTIDNHTMVITANDFVPIVPYQTDVVTLGIGQRADVVVIATGEPNAAVWMRSDISALCSVSNQPHALAIITYEDADVDAIPKTTTTQYDDSHCGNDPLNKSSPLYPLSPPSQPAITQTIDITFGANATGNLLWYMNNVSFRADFDNPILLLAALGNTSYPSAPDWNVYNFGSSPSIRLILKNHSATPRSSHPMHLHGHDFSIVAEGVGVWDGVANTHNPIRRDTHILLPADARGPGYMVMDFAADNPGVWALHCHIAWHVSAGLYVNVLERPDEIVQMRGRIPSIVAQTCREWATWSGRNVVEVIDSGL